MTTKQEVFMYIQNETRKISYNNMETFTANSVAEALAISRSLASSYLNTLAEENLLLKITSRPVYFLHRDTLLQLFRLEPEELEYFDRNDLEELLFSKREQGYFSLAIGYNGSLREVIKQMYTSIKYPPRGIPITLLGNPGTGKSYITKLVYREAKRKAIIAKNSQLIHIYVQDSDNDLLSFSRELFGDFENVGALERSNNGIVVINNAERLSVDVLKKLSDYTETGDFTYSDNTKVIKNVNARIVFIICNIDTENVEKLYSFTPSVCTVPKLEDRFKDEVIELILHIFREEERRICLNIKIEELTLLELSKIKYKNNITELIQLIKTICSNAYGDLNAHNNEDLYIRNQHLPSQLFFNLDTLTTKDSDRKYVDIGSYRYSDGMDLVLEYYDEILEIWSNKGKASLESNQFILDSHNIVRKYFDFLLFKREYITTPLRNIEKNISSILYTMIYNIGINIPVNWMTVISRIVYLLNENKPMLERWNKENSQKVTTILNLLDFNFSKEAYIIENFSRVLKSKMEIELDEIHKTIFIIDLINSYSSRRDVDINAIIIAHGYATASSIADAVNTMLGHTVFDAVDMPLDTSSEAIVERIHAYLERDFIKKNTFIFVDMGSLEDIGAKLKESTHEKIGVVNCLNTKSALIAGEMILRGESIEKIIEVVTEKSKLTYKLIDTRKNKAKILFVSENGEMAAERIASLFSQSLPKKIAVDIQSVDYNLLLEKDNLKKYLEENRVLFISGLNNIGFPDDIFIKIDTIINQKDVNDVKSRLKVYLTNSEIMIFRDNLIKNFTLENIMLHLTILEPRKLIEFVAHAVDLLQVKLNINFSGNTVTRLYMHIACLIERLVTKDPINTSNLDDFVKMENEFIKIVELCFGEINSYYGVKIPIGEISYLFDVLKIDGYIID